MWRRCRKRIGIRWRGSREGGRYLRISRYARDDMRQIQSRALGVGIVGGLVCLAAAFLDPSRFFHSYLIGFLFWLGITLGSLALLMVQYLSGGAWGFVIRRPLEAAARQIPLMAILFI